jgi:hypothetical protein
MGETTPPTRKNRITAPLLKGKGVLMNSSGSTPMTANAPKTRRTIPPKPADHKTPRQRPETAERFLIPTTDNPGFPKKRITIINTPSKKRDTPKIDSANLLHAGI